MGFIQVRITSVLSTCQMEKRSYEWLLVLAVMDYNESFKHSFVQLPALTAVTVTTGITICMGSHSCLFHVGLAVCTRQGQLPLPLPCSTSLEGLGRNTGHSIQPRLQGEQWLPQLGIWDETEGRASCWAQAKQLSCAGSVNIYVKPSIKQFNCDQQNYTKNEFGQPGKKKRKIL